MAGKASRLQPTGTRRRRVFTEEFRREAVQMLLDVQTAMSVTERLGLSHANLLYVRNVKNPNVLAQSPPRSKNVSGNCNLSCTASNVNATF